MSIGPAPGFTQEAIEAVGFDWAEVKAMNMELERLRATQLPAIWPEEEDDEFTGQKLTWKIANLEQAITYRTVMLADACALCWNASNLLGAVLAARALVETAAVLWDVSEQIKKLIDQKAVDEMDALVMNRLFATRLPDLLVDQAPMKAANILTIIDRLDRDYARGIRRHYEALSEFCHPNSPGHFILFSSLDPATGIIAYSRESRIENGFFAHVFAGFVLVGLVLETLDDLVRARPQIALLQS